MDFLGDPEEMMPEERLREIAAILATGYLRLRGRRPERVAELREKYREVLDEETPSRHKSFLQKRIIWPPQANEEVAPPAVPGQGIERPGAACAFRDQEKGPSGGALSHLGPEGAAAGSLAGCRLSSGGFVDRCRDEDISAHFRWPRIAGRPAGNDQ
jgi:hypothetical protein